MLQENISHKFGEVASLRGIFEDVKMRRKGRQPQHIMIVEDDPLTCQVVTNLFKENYVLVTAKNAQEAVANYLSYAPDVVFLDIGLPDVCGFEVLKQILLCDSEAYIVMFSSNNFPNIIARAIDEGAMGFVCKPFKPADLHLHIQDCNRHHHKS